MTMSFVFMTSPVRLPFERSRFFTLLESASKRLNVLKDMFGPVLEDVGSQLISRIKEEYENVSEFRPFQGDVKCHPYGPILRGKAIRIRASKYSQSDSGTFSP